MKKFLFVSIGFMTPTDEIKQAWGNWFMSIGDKIIDPGNTLGAGRELTRDGMRELPIDLNATTGYMLLQAENLDEALKIASTCPIITALRVYETFSM